MQKETPIRAVFFDAVGTLIHPRPPAAAVYAQVGKLFGSRLSADLVKRLFRIAFDRQEQLDRQADWRTNEQREVERWRSIVGDVLRDAADQEGCFAALYDHFSEPANWQCDPDAAMVIDELRKRGYAVGLASNFDRRLHRIVRAIEPLRAVEHVVISSEVGWRKPAAQFFARMCHAVGLSAAEVLLVGDDRVNDFDGALAAGCQAMLVDPAGQAAPPVTRIRNLQEILPWLETAHLV